MKKIILLALLFIPSISWAYSVSPLTYSSVEDTVSIILDIEDGSQWYQTYDADGLFGSENSGTYESPIDADGNCFDYLLCSGTNNITGNFHVLILDEDRRGDCQGFTYQECLDSEIGNILDQYEIIYSPIDPASDPIMNALIASSSDLFQATTGFEYSDLITWAGDIILQVLGGGLGLVNGLIGWIIAIIIFTVIIGLIYKSLKFLHILR